MTTLFQRDTTLLETGHTAEAQVDNAGKASLMTPDGNEPGGCRVVLYVEDNASNVRLVQRVLARHTGVTLLVATDGSTGLELARRHRPDLVLLDLNLPDLPGAMVLEQLRADEATHEIPVVIVSADATAQQQGRLREAGATEYLTKPFDIGRLLAIVDALPEPDPAKSQRATTDR